MSSPKDNTEVLRMLRDFKQLVHRQPIGGGITDLTSRLTTSPFFSSYHTNLGSRNIKFSSVATRLNFSNLDETDVNSFKGQIDEKTNSFSLDSDSADLKRKLINTEAELQHAKAVINVKETLISTMEPANKKLCLDLEKNLEYYKKQSEVDKDKIRELRCQLKTLMSQETVTRNKLFDCQREKEVEIEKLELKIRSLQHECGHLKSEILEVKSEKAEIVRKLNTEIGRLEIKLNVMTQEAEQSKDLIETLKRQLQEQCEASVLSSTLKEELNEAQQEIKELKNKIEADEDASIVARTMQSELKLLPELKRENIHLQKEISVLKENNVVLFQEKLWSLQEKLNKAERNSVILAKLQIENQQLQENIKEWESLFDDDNTNSKSPRSFSRKLSYYQKNEAVLTSKLGEVTSQCERMKLENQKLDNAVVSLKKSVEEAKEVIADHETLIRRLRRKILLLTKERDNSRKLIDSYVSETTLSGAVLNSMHIKTLDDTIADYKNALKKAEEEIEELEQKIKQYVGNRSSEEENEHIKEIQKLRNELSDLLLKIVEVKKEKQLLQEELSKKNKEVPEGKIVHLRCNPVDVAFQKRGAERKELIQENKRLQARIRVLEEEGSKAEDITIKVQQKLEVEETSTIQSLKEKLAAAEKKSKRLMEAFRSTTQEFREISYMLTGYKIEMPVESKYKLSHMYADSPDDFLLFEHTSEGVLQLLETEYSSRLTELIDTYLQNHDSIPAFLSSLTLDLFNHQTYVIAQS